MESYKTVIPEALKTASRTLFNGQATGTGDEKGILPAKSDVVYIVCLVTMAEATDLVLTVKTADDGDGLNTTALTDNISIFVDDVKQTAAKSHTISDDSGSFTVVFCVPTILVPTGKYLGLSFGNSNAANILSAIAIEDTYNNG